MYLAERVDCTSDTHIGSRRHFEPRIAMLYSFAIERSMGTWCMDVPRTYHEIHAKQTRRWEYLRYTLGHVECTGVAGFVTAYVWPETLSAGVSIFGSRHAATMQ